MEDGFVWHRRVGFGDCDPARIAYTGRIADFALEAIDAFWDDLLDGRGWYHMAVRQGRGMPFVRIEYDFVAPVVPGAPLICHVRPVRVGTTSVTLRVEGRQDDQPRFSGRFVAVFVEAATMRKIPVPDETRRALETRFPARAG